VTTIVSFVIVIGLLILIHELGHFFVARWTGVGVERFSIGFGPVLLRWKGKETEYCLSVIPMGGYVKMMGEEDNPLEGGGGATYDPAKAFAKKPLWARFLIVFAGPGMNLVLAAVIFAVVLGTLGRPVWPAAVGRVTEGGPAATAGLGPATWCRPSTAGRSLLGGSRARPAQRRRGHSGRAEGAAGPGRRADRDRHAAAARAFPIPIFREPRETWISAPAPESFRKSARSVPTRRPVGQGSRPETS
jgi:hypothetical protein